MLQPMLNREEDRLHVDIHQPIPISLVQFVQKLHLDDAGAVHDRLQSAELSHCLLNRCAHSGFATDVTVNEDGSSTPRADLLGDGLPLARLDVDQRNGCSLAREEASDSFAHAGGGAADPRYLV